MGCAALSKGTAATRAPLTEWAAREHRSLRSDHTLMGDGERRAKQRYGFYEIVEVRLSPTTRQQGIAGQKGTVIGVAQPETVGQPITYAVHFAASQETWSIDEDNLVTTGQFSSAEEIESGESLRVSR